MGAFGPYTVVRELARGGMGVVHEAVHEATGARYALKTVLGHVDPEELIRFQREAEALARLDHPHVVRVHAARFDHRPPFYVQDLLTGGSAQQRLRQGGPFDPADAATVTAKLARGLHAAHALGILHRDLKPDNVLFDERGEPKLVDFGLARVTAVEANRLTRSGMILGTPQYMAPEQAMDPRTVDAHADVYGLGAVCYALLCGQPPFDGPGLLAVLTAVVEDEPVPPSRIHPGVPPAIEAVCLRALAKEPGARFDSAAAFADALEAALVAPRRSPAPWLGAAALLALAVSGGAFALVSSPGKAPPAAPAPATDAPSAAPPPARSATQEQVARARDLLARGRATAAQEALEALGEADVPMDLRWHFALKSLSKRLRSGPERVTEELQRLENAGMHESRDAFKAIRAVYGADRRLLEGLSGDHHMDRRKVLAERVMGVARTLCERSVTIETVEELQQRLHIVILLTPEAHYDMKALGRALPFAPSLAGGNLDPAASLAEALAHLGRNDSVVLRRLINWCERSGSPDYRKRFLPIIDRALELETTAETLYSIRLVRLRSLFEIDGSAPENLAYATQLLEDEDLTANIRSEVLLVRARTRHRLNDLEAALADFNAALSIGSPNNARLYRAELLAHMGKAQEASDDAWRFVEGLSAVEHRYRATATRILWLHGRQQRERLRSAITRVCRESPTQVGWRLRLALVQLELGRVVEARATLDGAAAALSGYSEDLPPGVADRVRALAPKTAPVTRALAGGDADGARAALKAVVDELDSLEASGPWP